MSRRKAREMALQVLFQLDFNTLAIAEALQSIFEEHAENSEGSKTYTEVLVAGTQQYKVEIDSIISKLSNEWKIERMAGVDRNIARIAVYEMKFSEEKLAPNIIINEAVVLAKRFGTDDTAKFINGILGSLVKNRDNQ